MHVSEPLQSCAVGLLHSIERLGSHSQRGLLDIVLGGTAQQVSKAAPCLVVLVGPPVVNGQFLAVGHQWCRVKPY